MRGKILLILQKGSWGLSRLKKSSDFYVSNFKHTRPNFRICSIIYKFILSSTVPIAIIDANDSNSFKLGTENMTN